MKVSHPLWAEMGETVVYRVGERKELWKGSGTPRPLAVAGLLALKSEKPDSWSNLPM